MSPGRASMDLAVLVVEGDGKVSVAEGACEAPFGRAPAELAGRSVGELFRERAAILRGCESAIAGRADRVELDVDGAALEVRFEPRREAGAILVAQPAPDGNRYLRLVFHQIPGAAWATDRDLRVTYARGRLFAQPDLDQRRLIGMTIPELLNARDPTEPAVARHRAALAGETQSFRYLFRGRWLEVLIEPLRDGEGGVTGCVGAAVDVTERRQVEAQLERSRFRLEEAQRVAHIGSFEWDVGANTVTWSDELHRIYGIDRGQFGGTYEAFLDHVYPDDVESTKVAILDALRRPGPFAYEHRIVKPDGSLRDLHTRGDVITDENGKPLRLSGSCWDVTELKQAKAEAAQSISLLQATLDATADGLLVVDREGGVAAYNQRFLALWRIPPPLAERRDDAALIAYVVDQLEDPEGFLRGVRELYDGPERESFDVLRFKDGRVFERYSTAQRVGDEVVGRVWSFRDVTDRERLLRRALFLADATRLLASLDVEKALDGVAHLTVPFLGDGCAVDMLGNGGPRRLLAVSRDSARPIDPELHRGVLAGHPTIYSVDDVAYLGVPLIVKDKVVGGITFAGQPGRPYTPQDLELTEELARRAALSVENAHLYRGTEEALRSRDEFLSIAAHEIRGPLTSMHLAVQSLQRGGLSTDAAAKALGIIERDDRRLARFVDELLDLGRIRSGRFHFSLEEVDIAEVVRDVATRLGGELAASGSSLSITSSGRLVGRWDRFRLEQAASNLLSNAIKFGLGKPIDVVVGSDGERARLSVKDRGIGIPFQMHARIFNPFERAVSSRQYGGLGLGLYIVRQIVEGLGGTVRVESRPGEGSTFTIEVPRAMHGSS